MATEKKSGKKIESRISQSLHKRLKSKLKKQNISIAQVIRDAVQAYVKS